MNLILARCADHNHFILRKMKSLFLKFKIGQFFWISLVSFLAYYGTFSVQAIKGPMVACFVIFAALVPRYLFLCEVNWGSWEKKDLEKSVDLLRDLIICLLTYVIVYLPDWWFTKEIYSTFDKPVFFKLQNYGDTDYHTVRMLHKRYGLIIVILISTIDHWMVSEQTRKTLHSKP